MKNRSRGSALLFLIFIACLAAMRLALVAAEGPQDYSWAEGLWEDRQGKLAVQIKVLKNGRLSGGAWIPGKDLNGTIQEGTISGERIRFKVSF